MSFTHGLCGCTDDIALCCFTYLCHCYVSGKNAEAVDENCLLFGVLSMTPCYLCAATVIRGKVREKYSIEGSLVGDCCTHLCCPLCGICQEGQEVISKGDVAPGAICMSRE